MHEKCLLVGNLREELDDGSCLGELNMFDLLHLLLREREGDTKN